MSNYPDSFKKAAASNEVEDVYNGPDPVTGDPGCSKPGADTNADPRVTEGVYDGPAIEPIECVYAGPDYFGVTDDRDNKKGKGSAGKKIGEAIAEGAKKVSETVKRK